MSETTINLGSLPVNRGAYDGTENYYLLNEVMMFGMMFRAKTGTLETPLTGYTPAQLNESGNVVLVNTDKWELVAGTPDIYNEAARLTAVESDIADVNEDIEELQELYEALTQSDIIVGTLPDSGTDNKIYRVPGTTSYSDYMWYNSEFVLMATYNNAIDNTPTESSNNLAKSGGIWSWVTGLIANVKAWAEGIFARKDGFYEDLTAGNAVNILSEDLITEQSALGVTAPEDEVGDGMSSIQEIHGDGVAWNQLYKTEGLATETAQLNDLATRVVERFSDNAGTTPMGAFFVREKLTGHAFSEVPTTVTGEGYLPAVTEDNKASYSGIHYMVRATHAQVVTKAEGSDATSQFFTSGSTMRQVMDMAVIWGIEGSSTFSLPTSAPQTFAQMLAWLAQKVGISESYDFCEGELIGVTQLALTSMPGVNLLNPSGGVALCPWYAWGADSGKYRIQAPSGTTISSVTAEALSGQAVEVTTVTSGSQYEVVVPEGDAVVLVVSVSAGSLASCAVWQVWDDSTQFADIAAFTQDSLYLSVGRIYGKENGEGSLVKVWSDGVAKRSKTRYGDFGDVLDIANDKANIKVIDRDLGNTSQITWKTDLSAGRFLSSQGFSGSQVVKCSYKYNQFTGNFLETAGRLGIGLTNNGQYICVRDDSFNGSISAWRTFVTTNHPHVWINLPAASQLQYLDLHYDRSSLGDGSDLVPLAEAFNANIRIGNCGVKLDTTNWNASTNRFATTPVAVAPQTVSQMPSNIVEQVDTNRQFNENLRTSLPTALAAAGVTGIQIAQDGTATFTA